MSHWNLAACVYIIFIQIVFLMHQLGNESNTCKKKKKKSNSLVRVSTNVYLLTHSHTHRHHRADKNYVRVICSHTHTSMAKKSFSSSSYFFISSHVCISMKISGIECLLPISWSAFSSLPIDAILVTKLNVNTRQMAILLYSVFSSLLFCSVFFFFHTFSVSPFICFCYFSTFKLFYTLFTDELRN